MTSEYIKKIKNTLVGIGVFLIIITISMVLTIIFRDAIKSADIADFIIGFYVGVFFMVSFFFIKNLILLYDYDKLSEKFVRDNDELNILIEHKSATISLYIFYGVMFVVATVLLYIYEIVSFVIFGVIILNELIKFIVTFFVNIHYK
jgi:uncharacterized membrane protein